MEMTREQALQLKPPRFGNANPDSVRNPFWKYMIRQRRNAYFARQKFNIPYSATRLQTLAATSAWRQDPEGPVWCFTRHGRTVTMLSDGRLIYVGGEHEDWYDPDFCIYSDVVVEDTDGNIEICIYPETVFPPTDFHTASLVGKTLYLVGCLGYKDARAIGETPVYRLNVDTYAISRLESYGDCPGWIFKHEAEFDRANNEIRVWGGSVLQPDDTMASNSHEYALSLSSEIWRVVS